MFDMKNLFSSPRLLSAAYAWSLVIVLPHASVLADWPQWRGPERDGHAADQSLLSEWPEGGPALAWEFDNAGAGYSSVAVADGRLYTLGNRDGNCHLIVLDAESGKRLFSQSFARAGNSDDYNTGWGAGSRSTPTIDGDQVFVLSDVGIVAAFNRTSGDLLWKRDLVGEFGGSIPTWGYSESVLVDGDRIVVTPGGKNFLIALDRNSGKQVWSSQGIDKPAQYVSVMKMTVGGTSLYVTATKAGENGGRVGGIVGIDAQSGEVLFREVTATNDVAVIPTPIVQSPLLYYTSGYRAGNTLLELTAADDGGINAEIRYENRGKSMSNHHGGVVLVDGVVYGVTQADGGVWMAQDFESGEVLWTHKVGRNRSGSIAFADGRLYCYNDKDGSVHLVVPSRDEWKSVGELTLPRETEMPRNKGAIWAHPVIAGGKLFIRDQDLVFAYNIARP